MDTQLLPDNLLTTQLKKVVNWARRSSLWPMPFATACCGIELMATASSRYDLARFGAEAMRFSPRQSDLMIVAGRVTIKMMPVLQHIYQQMTEPKWVISMGACASTGGVFDAYATDPGHRPIHAGGCVRSRLPAAPGNADRRDHGDPANHRSRRPAAQRFTSSAAIGDRADLHSIPAASAADNRRLAFVKFSSPSDFKKINRFTQHFDRLLILEKFPVHLTIGRLQINPLQIRRRNCRDPRLVRNILLFKWARISR